MNMGLLHPGLIIHRFLGMERRGWGYASTCYAQPCATAQQPEQMV